MRDVMRTLLIALWFLLASLSGHAQGDHLKVLGLPITGNITDFSAKLKAKGYTLVGNANGPSKLFKGKFAGKDCHVFVLYDEKTRVVSSVQFRWARLYFDKGELDDLKAHLVSLLDKKYPQANKTQDSQYLPSQYTYKLHNGAIMVEMEETDNVHVDNGGGSGYYLWLVYTDYANAARKDKSLMDDL